LLNGSQLQISKQNVLLLMPPGCQIGYFPSIMGMGRGSLQSPLHHKAGSLGASPPGRDTQAPVTVPQGPGSWFRSKICSLKSAAGFWFSPARQKPPDICTGAGALPAPGSHLVSLAPHQPTRGGGTSSPPWLWRAAEMGKDLPRPPVKRLEHGRGQRRGAGAGRTGWDREKDSSGGEGER